MAFPRRGSRRITVDGTVYLWLPQVSHSLSYAIASETSLLVQQEDNPTSILTVELPFGWRDLVRPVYVAAFIRLARSLGWQPDQPGPGFFLAPEENAALPAGPHQIASLAWKSGTGRPQTHPPPAPVVPRSPEELTEEEWLQDHDSRRLFDFIRLWASDRKLRLFAVGCCRLFTRLDGDDLAGLTVAERLADDLATNEERKTTRRRTHRRAEERQREFGWVYTEPVVAAEAVDRSLDREAALAAQENWRYIHTLFSHRTPHDPVAIHGPFCRLLRSLFGNPFRPAALDPGWLFWREGAVERLARHIYDAKAFEELPILADALEDAGCTHVGLLAHCRSKDDHVRGDWLLDLILGLD
jgi:hypothetical protein